MMVLSQRILSGAPVRFFTTEWAAASVSVGGATIFDGFGVRLNDSCEKTPGRKDPDRMRMESKRIMCFELGRLKDEIKNRLIV
jgi:hypothetical protein